MIVLDLGDGRVIEEHVGTPVEASPTVTEQILLAAQTPPAEPSLSERLANIERFLRRETEEMSP